MLREPLDPINSPEDRAKIEGYLRQFEKDSTFLNDHRREWTKEYPDQWVIVFNEELVANGPTIESALHAAEEKNVPTHLAALEYLSSKPISLILPVMTS